MEFRIKCGIKESQFQWYGNAIFLFSLSQSVWLSFYIKQYLPVFLFYNPLMVNCVIPPLYAIGTKANTDLALGNPWTVSKHAI